MRDLFAMGHSRRIRPDLAVRILRRLDALAQATRPQDMNIPGFNFHRLSGRCAGRYSIHVNGPWCITFGWQDGEPVDVDLVNYH